MSKNSPEKHPDGFVSIRVVPREIGKVIYADRWEGLAKRFRKRDDLSREYGAALKDGADAVTIASISSRLSAATSAVRPEWGRLLIEADRLITSDALPLYHYHRGNLPYPVPKDCFAGDTEEHARARRRMLLTGKIQEVVNLRLDNVKLALNKRYLVKRGRQVDLRSLMRNSTGNVTLVTDKDAETPGLVIVLEHDLREALQQLRGEPWRTADHRPTTAGGARGRPPV